ncbi:MAG: hypothetical protein LBR87_01675 [Synergistaceae bacterium]|nr:hypothetical protein [Synergistaceae bacterium]
MMIVCCAVFLSLPAGDALHAGEIKAEAGFEVFPAVTGMTQDITITLPPEAQNDTEVFAETSSGWGVLLFPSAPAASGRIKCSPGVPLRLQYRWAGPPPVNGQASESVKVEAPGLGSAETRFKIGIDLRIDDISLPRDITAGTFNPVDIILKDAFDPGLDAASILGKAGIRPEISLSLVRESSSGEQQVPDDPVIRRFFGSGKQEADTFPSDAFTPGSLISREGRLFWQSPDGRISGVSPVSAGRYHIEAILKSNAGAVALRHWTSPPFEASWRASFPRTDLPPLVASTLEILAAFDRDAASKAAGNFARDGSLPPLGEALQSAFTPDAARMLGRYAAALGASGRGEEEIAVFLSNIMKGFSGRGVLLVTKNGLIEWVSEGAAIFEGDRILAIPFESGKDVTVRLTGASADVSLWKIMDQGVNTRKYPRGNWIKEITVLTSEVNPRNAAIN